MKTQNKVITGVVVGAVALIFLPITKILIGGAVCSAAYYGYKKITK